MPNGERAQSIAVYPDFDYLMNFPFPVMSFVENLSMFAQYDDSIFPSSSKAEVFNGEKPS